MSLASALLLCASVSPWLSFCNGRPELWSGAFVKDPRCRADKIHDPLLTQGNAMPISLDNPSRKLTDSRLPSGRQNPGKPETREAAHRLTKLLASAPVDLSGVSNEIRRHPDLESLILRPGISLVPSLPPSLVPSIDEPLSTIEEAVVVLGTSRLRTLIDLWSSTNPIDIGLLQTHQNGASS